MLRLIFRLIMSSIVLFSILIQLVILLNRYSESHLLTYILAENTDETPVVHLVDMATGVNYPLGNSTDNHQGFLWSPDGNQLLYQSVDGDDIYVQSLYFDDARQDLFLPDIQFSSTSLMRWSPNGEYLVFEQSSDNDDTQDILSILTRATNDIRPLSETIAQADSVAWFPDNQRFVVRGTFSGSASNFAVVDITNPNDLTYLTEEANLYDSMSPLPDGSGSVLVSGWELAFLADEPSATPVTLVTGSDAYSRVDISPDGQSMLYLSVRRFARLSSPLSVYNFETHAITAPIRTRGILYDAQWSPDGEWIAYAYYPNGKPPNYREIYIIRPDGTDHQLIATGFTTITQIGWRP